MKKTKEHVFLCGARDYHAMDWYRSAQEQIPNEKLSLLTDLIQGEGFKKLITENDRVYKLLILDPFLLKKQSSVGNVWRNFIKFLVLPLQIILLKRFHKNRPNSVYHAHGMYYIWLAASANVPFIGTPQGSEILIRPFRSKLYHILSSKSMKKAINITVDSVKMQEKVFKISGVTPEVIQNGIDLKSIELFQINKSKSISVRDKIVSQRGMTPLYRIEDILMSRNKIKGGFPISFIYPFYEEKYKKKVLSLFNKRDKDMGRVDREKMYDLFSESKLIISIPSSDSSPRSVYEAIFCGAIVGITYNPYYDILPQSMKDRVTLINLDDKNWFINAVNYADNIVNCRFVPSKEALDTFDQRKSFKKILNLFN